MPGVTYFFTVKLLERYPNDLLLCRIDFLRAAVCAVSGVRTYAVGIEYCHINPVNHGLVKRMSE